MQYVQCASLFCFCSVQRFSPEAGGDGAANRKRFFVRAIVRQTERIQTIGDIFDQFPGPEVQKSSTLCARAVCLTLLARVRCVDWIYPAVTGGIGRQHKLHLKLTIGFVLSPLFVQRMFVEGLNALNIAMGDALKDVSLPVGNNHVFLNVIPPVEVDPNYVDACLKNLARRYSDRLRRLRVSQVLCHNPCFWRKQDGHVAVAIVLANVCSPLHQAACAHFS
jgi:hypothetical protein